MVTLNDYLWTSHWLDSNVPDVTCTICKLLSLNWDEEHESSLTAIEGTSCFYKYIHYIDKAIAGCTYCNLIYLLQDGIKWAMKQVGGKKKWAYQPICISCHNGCNEELEHKYLGNLLNLSVHPLMTFIVKITQSQIALYPAVKRAAVLQTRAAYYLHYCVVLCIV